MLTIRTTQIEEFKKQEALDFEARLVAHVRRFFAFQGEYLGDEGLVAVIRPAVERAQAVGLTTEKEIGYYVTLTFLLGSGFEVDPQYDWVAAPLCECTGRRPLDRVKQAYDEVIAYLDAIAGARNEMYTRALMRLRSLNIMAIDRQQAEEALPVLRKLLHELYPEKYERLGAATVQKLVGGSLASAQRMGYSSARGVVLVGVAGYFLGSSFDADPQFPWAQAVLGNRAVREEERQVEMLVEAARGYLNHALEYTPA